MDAEIRMILKNQAAIMRSLASVLESGQVGCHRAAEQLRVVASETRIAAEEEQPVVSGLIEELEKLAVSPLTGRKRHWVPLADVLALAKAACALPPAGWQPIETAPKRGRVLLSAEGQVCYGHWYEPQSRWEYDGYDFGNPESQPTHWMPLPPPVSAEA